MNIQEIHEFADNFSHVCEEYNVELSNNHVTKLMANMSFLLGENISLERYAGRLEAMNKELIACLKTSENI